MNQTNQPRPPVPPGSRAVRASLFGRLLAKMNLRFPGLFALLLVLTVADFLVPDPIPFLDEIVLALLTALFALWKDRRAAAPPAPAPPPKPLRPGA